MIRKMVEEDREAVLEMMRVFYASPAVLSNGSEEIFQSDIDHCVNDSPYMEGFIITGIDKLNSVRELPSIKFVAVTAKDKTVSVLKSLFQKN